MNDAHQTARGSMCGSGTVPVRGQPFRDKEQLAWCDPFCQGGWTYLIVLAEEAAGMGFDEVQFDNVRFPAAGQTQFTRPNTEAARVDAITGFPESAGSDGGMLWNPRNTDTAEGLHPR